MAIIRVAAVLLSLLGGGVVWGGDALSSAEGALAAEKYSVALATLERLDVKEASEPRARFLKGTALAGIGRLDEAAAILEKLVSEQPRMPEAMNNLAMVYARQGKAAQAKQLLERAIRLEDRYAVIHDNLNTVYEGMARSSYAKALRIEAAPTPRLELMHSLAVDGQGSSVKPPVTSEKIELAAAEAMPSAKARVESKSVAATEPLASGKSATASESTVPAASGAAASAEPKLAPPAKLRVEPKVVTVTEPVVNTKGAVAPESTLPVATGPVASAEPKTAATTTATPLSPLQATLEQRLNDWAAAWSAKDVERYLSFYSPEFIPGRGVSHEAWVNERRERVGKPEWIKVVIDGVKVKPRSDSLVDVTLTQHYDTPDYSDSSVKRVRLALSKGQWLIISETTLSAGRR